MPMGSIQDNSQMVPQSQRYPEIPQKPLAPLIFSANGSMASEFPGQIQTPYYGSNPMGGCAPLQAPAYELPVNDAQRAQAAQALNVAIDQSQGATQRLTYPMRRVDMSKVAGYYDEELENFLSTQSAKTQQENPVTTPTTANLTATIPITTALASSSSDTSGTTSFKYIQSPQYIMDLLLFIAAGILVILLCDQIFKLGMSFGMRDTVKVLMPYLQELKITEG
jgi:hypothetical protein